MLPSITLDLMILRVRVGVVLLPRQQPTMSVTLLMDGDLLGYDIYTAVTGVRLHLLVLVGSFILLNAVMHLLKRTRRALHSSKASSLVLHNSEIKDIHGLSRSPYSTA